MMSNFLIKDPQISLRLLILSIIGSSGCKRPLLVNLMFVGVFSQILNSYLESMAHRKIFISSNANRIPMQFLGPVKIKNKNLFSCRYYL